MQVLRLCALLGALLQLPDPVDGRRGRGPPPPSMEILQAANCHQPGHNVTESCWECHDLVDNDNDGQADCSDPDCITHPYCFPEDPSGGGRRGDDDDDDDFDDIGDVIAGVLLAIVLAIVCFKCNEKRAAAATGGDPPLSTRQVPVIGTVVGQHQSGYAFGAAPTRSASPVRGTSPQRPARSTPPDRPVAAHP